MNPRGEYIEQEISKRLSKYGIEMHYDWERRHDNKFLDNIVFMYGGKIKKVYSAIVRRETGQSHHFVKKGNDFELEVLTDKTFIEDWVHNIRVYFGLDK